MWQKSKNQFIISKTFLTLSIFLLSTVVFAQTAISGEIIDQQNKPIPFAHLRFKDNNMGTISNEEGLFRLVPNKNGGRETIISAIGYKTKNIRLKEGFNTVKLVEDIIQLQGVTVTPINYGKELVKKAINAIPSNYPRIEERHTGFFREITYWEKQEPIYIIESETEAIKTPYGIRAKKGKTRLKEFRKYESGHLDSLNTRIFAGAHHIFRFDVVARREACLGNPNDYNYKILDTIPQGNSKLFKVFFEKKSKISGTLFIQDKTYSIVKAEYNYQDFSWSGIFFGLDRQFYKFATTYNHGPDGYWRYNHSHYETAFIEKNDKILYLTSDYVSTNVMPNNESIPYLEQLQFEDILLNDTKEYDPEFWDNYTIVLPQKKYEDLFRNASNNADASSAIEEITETNKKPNSLIEILSRFSNDYLITTNFIKNRPYSLTYGNGGLNIGEAKQAGKSTSIGLRYTVDYKFPSTIRIGFAMEEPIFKSGSRVFDFVILKDFNINPRGRPITFSPSLTFGWQRINQFIGGFENPSEIQIGSKTFDVGKINVYVSQKNFRLMPKLGFGIEKSRKLKYVVSLGYNFQLNEKPGLFFEENEGFFLSKKHVFVENGKENVSVSLVDNNMLVNKIVLNAGLILSL